MYSQTLPVFDAPQTIPIAPRSYKRTETLHEASQSAGWLTSRTNELTGVQRFGQGLAFQAHPYVQQTPTWAFEWQLRDLEQRYTIVDTDGLLSGILEEEPTLHTLLVEAIDPLLKSFGHGHILQLRVLASDDDRILKVAVQAPASSGDNAEQSLRSFDSAWWLNNCDRSKGSLVFDYEIQDAV